MGARARGLILVFLAVPAFAVGLARAEAKELKFDGGPSGGTYTIFAEGLVSLWKSRLPELTFVVSASSGSVSNLVAIEEGRIDLAIATAADIAAAVDGRLEALPAAPQRVRAASRLFGQYAHLAVLKNAPMAMPADLSGKRVAVGTRGSGTLSSARRFFSTLEMWDRIKPEYVSFDLAIDDFLAGRLQAVWQLVGYPSASLVAIGEKAPTRLIDLGRAAAETPLYQTFPFYTPGTIPAGTYPGQTRDVATFQDQAILIVSSTIDPELLQRLLAILYSPQGLQHMRKVHPIAAELDRGKGRLKLPLPYHPGADRFWAQER